MKLRRIALRPFGGFAEKEFRFADGLNVVLGPNDAGKSTLFRSIDSALFLPVKLRASTVEGKNLKRLIPVGGDHAKVRLEFSVAGKDYSLEKTWGANLGCELKLPDGVLLTAPEKVEEKLRELLPTPPATFQSVLLTHQNALDRTMEEFERSPESLHSLGDTLRKAVELTGGVSVEKFKAELTDAITEALGNWDVATNSPKGGRGIANPWQKNNGRVIEAYYRRENLKKKLAETQSIENELGEKLRLLSVKQGELSEKREFVEKNREVVEAVATRANLELQLRQAEKEAAELTRDFSGWVQAESDRKLFEAEVKRLEEKRAQSEAELKGAAAGASRKEFLLRFEKIEAAKKRADEARSALANVPAMKAEDLKRVLQANAGVQSAKSCLQAGKLKVQFTAKARMDLSVQKNFDPPRKGALEAGGLMSIQSGGRLQILSDLFELTVVSGEGGVVEAEKSLQNETASLQKILTELQVTNAEEAQQKHEQWLVVATTSREADGLLRALLGRDEFEALQKRFLADREGATGRDLETIQKEFQEVTAQFSEKRSALATALKTVKELGQKHGVEEAAALTRLMVKRSAEAETLKEKITSLPLPPGEITDAPAFVSKFRAYQAALGSLAEEVRVVSNSVAELKARMPEQSAQDFLRQSREAESAFDAELRRARALLRVEEVSRRVEQEAGDIYRGFREEFESTVHSLSAGKYSKAKMQGSIPAEFRRKDGAEIPFEWLSAGTKDAFALALRLSMAQHFLAGAEGFLLIDDPMVAMDPARQDAATALLRNFAAQSQVVVFTCHPAHAERLGGNLISF